jgi:putative ABC transport system substrate-binding protein
LNPQITMAMADLRDLQAVAQSLGIETHPVEIASFDEVEPALLAALAGNSQALFMTSVTPQHRPAIIGFDTRHGLPTAGGDVSASCLLSYQAELPPLWHPAVSYHVDRILRGATPADLPVEGPTVFEMIVMSCLRATTAYALGLTPPLDFAAQVTKWVD